ncbi:MAG: phosphoenolpyruvate carboxykinase [Bacteroidales bacterium]|nr:phosphoenolpyruvate carboxykinase [Bacteroidales bacterium]MBK7626386.1 phosphoenolpyruvate carboxykinase [Bacteroidales bacterium]
MQKSTLRIIGNKAVLNIRERMCETAEELLASDKFRSVLDHCLENLKSKNSPLVCIFYKCDINESSVNDLVKTLTFLVKYESNLVPHIFENAKPFLKDLDALANFVEYLYDYWRHFDRFIINDSEGDRLDKRPYRTFNETIEQLTHLIRTVYRHIQENITGSHPRVYRQVPAGAEMAVISLPKDIAYSDDKYKKLNSIHVIRQMLIYPPLVIQQPMNKRTGHFKKIDKNPIDLVDLESDEWICYPAKVGKLLIMVYFHLEFFELGFSMCNLFQLAGDDDLLKKPDALFIYGVPGNAIDGLSKYSTVFYDDEKNGIFVGAIPNRSEFGYFGYLKKMILTLHNSIIMKAGNMPFHGAMVKILLQGNKEATILMMGDTGAGKSETLEAFRVLAEKHIRQLTIIADDMGSIELDENGCPIGYGTEIGAFLRLDDLQPGYAFGHLDRSIIMNPSQVNARIVFPVTKFETVIQGHKIDYILYANNYEEIDNEHPVIEKFSSAEWALDIFSEGAVMSKGTTTSSGLVHSYFANIFGPPEYKEVHDKIAAKYFASFFKNKVFVGQMRTRLGIAGYESTGPRDAATELLRIIGVTE